MKERILDFVSDYEAVTTGRPVSHSVALAADLPIEFPHTEPVTFAPDVPDRGLYRGAGKRALDIAMVLVSLPVTLAVISLCALALWIEGGNPFYTQARIGRNGKLFSILKLRTMVRDADARMAQMLADDPALRLEWETTQKLKNDPRITRVGAFLRKTSLDELPQLWNVLRGDMSLVGPRPMMPDQLSVYGDPTHYYALKPGITGLWQVTKRNESLFVYRVTMDRLYNTSLSFHKDLVLLFKTVGVVLKQTGY